MKASTMLRIGDIIRKLREDKHWTQKTLSEKSGVHEVQIRRYENNQAIPRDAQLSKIANALGVDKDCFFYQHSHHEVSTQDLAIAEKIKRAREEKGITQKELGKLLNTSVSTIAQYEAGERHPNPDTIYKISDALKISPTELFDELPPSPILTIDGKSFRTGTELKKHLQHTGERDILLNIYENILNEKGQKKLFDYAIDLSNLNKYVHKDRETP